MRNAVGGADNVEGSMDVTQGREVLPKHIKPTHYQVELEPKFDDFTFVGKLSIE